MAKTRKETAEALNLPETNTSWEQTQVGVAAGGSSFYGG